MDSIKHVEMIIQKYACVCMIAKAAYPTEHKNTERVDHANGGRPYEAQEEPNGIPVQLKIHWLWVEN